LRRTLTSAAALLMLAGCATAPRDTVAGLNKRDPEYRTRDCRQARAAAARFKDHKEGRLVLALAGNMVVPFAGTAAAAAMGAMQEDDKEALNKRVKAACISDPLKRKRSRVARR